ncbi:MAG TPA: MotA/TolQ/ExbB proton channel family protein [Bryobacteraceae bacterium]|nr:MotA/TolQ/ExbB proton channel family protein [Bryobacteraceae bacterium]
MKQGDELSFPAPVAFLLQSENIWQVIQGDALALAVMGVLICFSVYSWTIIFSKWATVRGARKTNDRFLRAFRKASGLEAVMVASERYRPSPLVTVFDFGYEEVERQVRGRNKMTNRVAVERALQIGVSEEMTRLERNMNWLATTATASPFIGLLGTVLGIIKAFMDLSTQQSTSLRTVGPGIAEALIATAIGLLAAIPAAIFYNLLTTRIKDIGTRMDDFALEFLNMVERGFGE